MPILYDFPILSEVSILSSMSVCWKPAVPNEIPNRVQSLPPPIDAQGELEYEISEVLDSKIDHRRSCKLLYLVRWLGYENTDEEFSWLPATELDAKDLISDFHSAYPAKPGPVVN